MKELEDILKTSTEFSLSKKTVLNITYSSVWMRDAIASVLKPFDISIEQFNVLRILRGQKGEPINLQDIQDRMISKMSNTTRLVDKLILKKYVKRFTCEKNRRKVEIFITDEGLKILAQIDPLIEAIESDITSGINHEEMITLNNLLTKIRK